MKFIAAALLALSAVGDTSAFTSPSFQTSSALRMTVDAADPMPEPTPEVPVPEEPRLPEMSESMPFMARPAALTGELAGDVGFDPLGFAKSKEELTNFREAEVKHARLAMLAAAGWPLSELFDKKIAAFIGAAPVLDASDRAPSILNGGLGKISPVYWGVCIAAAAAIDLYGLNRARSGNADYFPGDLGFDPLGLYPKDKKGQEWMQTAEIKNGRLAMIAITAFAVQEAVSKLGVIDETPLFFKPIGETMHELTNSGYIQ